MNPATPKTNALKAKLPDPVAVQELLASHGELERQLHDIAALTKSLHDSPKSFLSQMTDWVKRQGL
jgi:hypothetical protein